MNLQENIQRIKEVMGLNEVEVRSKPVYSGSYKDVYPVESNPDIVYKVSGYYDLLGEKNLFGENPDLFSKTYGEIKKLNSPNFKWSSSYGTDYMNVNGEKSEYVPNDKEIDEKSYYLAFEKLDTKKFEDFYSTMQEVYNTYATDEIKKLWEYNAYGNKIDYFFSIIFEIATNLNKNEVVDMFHSMNPIIEKETPQYYSDYLNFVDLLYKITTLKEYNSDAYWDFNSGNFGYDKNGKIKSLDI
jgi:hypothetical protein